MKYSDQREVVTDTVQPTGSGGLGALLFTVRADQEKILKGVLLRLGLTVLAFLLNPMDVKESVASKLIFVGIYAVFTLFPTIHLKDAMQLYENGICFKGQAYLLNPTAQITWESTTILVGTSTFLDLGVGGRALNVTYLKNPKKMFYQTYGNIM